MNPAKEKRMSSATLPLTVTAERTAAPFRLGHRPALDGLRGIAILLVYFYHLGGLLFGSRSAFVTNGFLGVDVFFVLSGFLITTLLLEEWNREGEISLRNFYWRRFCRLIPALAFFLLTVVIVSTFTLSQDDASGVRRSALHALFYSTNWITAYRFGLVAEPLGHMWSLAMEEQFYLLWPTLLVFLLRRKASRRIIAGITVTAIVIICLHRMALTASDVWVHRIYSGPDTRADSLLVGCLVSMVLVWGIMPATRIFRITLSILVIVAVLVIGTYLSDFISGWSLASHGFTSFALAVGAVILYLMHSQPRILTLALEPRALVWLGRRSYGVYLWHVPALLVLRAAPGPAWVRALIATMLLVGIAALSFHFIEQPFLKLKEQFSKLPTLR